MKADVNMLNKVFLIIFGVLALIVAVSLVGCDDGDIECLPDLLIESIYVQQPVQPGNATYVMATVRNRGAVGTGGTCTVEFLVEGVVCERNLRMLRPISSEIVYGLVIVPDDFVGSSALVIVTADSRQEIAESVEDNNSAEVRCAVDRYLSGGVKP